MKWYLMAFQKYAQFQGRSSRQEYWMFFLMNFVAGFFLGLGIGLLKLPPASVGIYQLAILVPSFAVAVRRCHDTNKSGWYLLVPIYNIVLMCLPGDQGSNSFGDDPHGSNAQIDYKKAA
jgi:uncharacterized membrane protein YhaH (DUF805 family)